MKKVNVYVDGSVRWAAYKKDDEYQTWIDYAVANNLWGTVGAYTVEVVDATAELEEKRLQAEATKKTDFDSHITNFNSLSNNFNTHSSNLDNPHQVTKAQLGLGNVDDVSASSLRDRSTHTGTQLASTISDFNEAAQDAVGNALLDSANIDFVYPDVSNQITADLTDTGVVAGTYSLVTVDAKGRIIEGSNVGNATIYKYFNAATASNTNATYTTVAELTTQSLPVGLYKFSFVGRMQSAAAASGVGVRVSPVAATVTTCYGDWHLKQAANGVNAVFHYEQLATNTNVTSASVPALNTSFVVSGSGVFRVTVAGTVAIQIRGETNGTAATLQTDSSFIVEPA